MLRPSQYKKNAHFKLGKYCRKMGPQVPGSSRVLETGSNPSVSANDHLLAQIKLLVAMTEIHCAWELYCFILLHPRLVLCKLKENILHFEGC
ncbi:hypothetical protein FKM82_010871 [Ascaphus truei]